MTVIFVEKPYQLKNAQEYSKNYFFQLIRFYFRKSDAPKFMGKYLLNGSWTKKTKSTNYFCNMLKRGFIWWVDHPFVISGSLFIDKGIEGHILANFLCHQKSVDVSTIVVLSPIWMTLIFLYEVSRPH